MSYYNTESINYSTRYKSHSKQSFFSPVKKTTANVASIFKPAFSLICISFLFLIITPMFGTPYPVEKGKEAWRFLEKAQIAYENGNLDNALKLANQARNTRKLCSEWSVEKLIEAYKPVTVQKEGSDIETIRDVLYLRENYEAVSIIDQSLALHSIDYYKYNINNIISYWKKASNYPEADKITASVYREEGEYDLSQLYLEKAWEYRDILDITEEQYDILYDLAKTALFLNNQDLYEKSLLMIVSDDVDFSGSENNIDALSTGIVKAIKKGINLDKLFLLYRHNTYFDLQALIDLSYYYKNINQNEKALECVSFACVTAVTQIFNQVEIYDDGYYYEDFNQLLKKASSVKEINDWMNDYSIWNLFYNFAIILENTSDFDLSNDIIMALVKNSNDYIVQKKALIKMSK